jgi:L-threonylcarbamoyladenylate synthase
MISLNYPFPPSQARKSLEIITSICRTGGVIVYPTETFYAIGGNALNQALGQHLTKIKKRPAKKPFPTVVGDLQSLEKLITHWPENARELANRYWPGPLTMILPGLETLPAAITGDDNSIAVRWSPHPLINDLARILHLPLISTSANLSGRPPVRKAREIDPEIIAAADLLIIADNDDDPNPQPSTIIDVRVTPPLLLRPGAVTIS